MMTILIAGMLLGLMSSLHCVGMCGPLVMAFPMASKYGHPMLNIFLYNTGRVFTYALFGLFFGLIGRQFYIAGVQKWISIIIGVLMVLITLYYFYTRRQNNFSISFLQKYLQRMIYWLARKQNAGGIFLMGMVNGLLPCGMVYLALAGAVSTGAVADSILFMTAFGTGTLPLLAGVGLLGWKLSIPIRQKLLGFFPYITMMMGVFLVLRGLELGIPYISPVLPTAGGQPVICY